MAAAHFSLPLSYHLTPLTTEVLTNLPPLSLEHKEDPLPDLPWPLQSTVWQGRQGQGRDQIGEGGSGSQERGSQEDI